MVFSPAQGPGHSRSSLKGSWATIVIIITKKKGKKTKMKMGIGHPLWCEVWTLIERPFQRSKNGPLFVLGKGGGLTRESFSSVCSILLPLYYVWLLLPWQFFKQLNRAALSFCKLSLIAPMHQACPHNTLHTALPLSHAYFHKFLGIVQLSCPYNIDILGQRIQEASLGRREGTTNFPCVSKPCKPGLRE